MVHLFVILKHQGCKNKTEFESLSATSQKQWMWTNNFIELSLEDESRSLSQKNEASPLSGSAAASTSVSFRQTGYFSEK